MNENAEAFAVRWWFLILALLLGTAITVTVLRPWFMDQDTAATRHSVQFISSHQSALRTLYTQYQTPGIEPAHRNALRAQMQAEADLIPGNVPPDIAAVLGGGR